jgi:hypothetical protein
MTVLNSWGTASKPTEFTTDDGQNYIVKDSVARRQCVNDQVVAVVAAALNAPTGRAGLVDVSGELIQATPFLQQNSWVAGVWHGSLRVGDVSEAERVYLFTDLPENRLRFAELAILYGWAFTQHDHQFVYQKTDPRLVFSVDHGHFFPNGPNWDVTLLASHTTVAVPDPSIVAGCRLTNDELREGAVALVALDVSSVIARSVAAPHDHWTDPMLTLDERVALAKYLDRRYAELVTTIENLSS